MIFKHAFNCKEHKKATHKQKEMALSTMRTRVSLLPSRPVSEPTSVRNLMGDYGGQVELRPVYQRDIRWKRENMCELIKTVMNQGLIPGLILYKLQAEEREDDSPFRYEMVDGQHRFFTIQKYFKSELVEEAGGKPFMITWVYRDEAAGRDVHIFYKKNAATEEWESKNRSIIFSYMTDDDRDAFNSFKLDIKEIKDPLTLDQRRGLFDSLQRGVSVRGSDLLKNRVAIPLIRFITDELRVEAKIKSILAERCWMNPKNYWLHWVIRCFFILGAEESDNLEEEEFAIRDSAISQMIKDESPKLNCEAEETAALKAALDRFFTFLDSLPKGVKLSPCHFYALFTHLAKQAEATREDILRGHIDDWANNRKAKSWKKGWENRKSGDDDEERSTYFSSILEELDRIRVPVREPEARKSIPKKLRQRVWRHYFGEEEEGICFCCGDEISFEEEYEACHVIAHKHGGSDTLDNLRPGCRSCNRSMGTQNMSEFKKQFYPEADTPLSDEGDE